MGRAISASDSKEIGGTVLPARTENTNDIVDMKQLRRAIPDHFFKPLHRCAVWYTLRDAVLVLGFMALGAFYIPQVEHQLLRGFLWICYGYIEGLFMTGMWVIGHEAGHGGLSPSNTYNNIVGFCFHSFLLTPYFSWRSTHQRHHIYANNLDKDHNYVPPRRNEYQKPPTKYEALNELFEDAPLFVLLRLILQQAIGFPFYLLTNIASAPGSIVRPSSRGIFTENHFSPWSPLFRPSEMHLILLSDLGVLAASLGLVFAVSQSSLSLVALAYFHPWFWVNHWLVAITYLHHTHPDVPKFEDEAWTFIKGATSTIDRDFGWVGRTIFHNITDYHVVHHVFPKIPFYYGEQATQAIRGILGSHYREDRRTHWSAGLWQAFTQCKWVEPDDAGADPAKQTMWYKTDRASSRSGQLRRQLSVNENSRTGYRASSNRS